MTRGRCDECIAKTKQLRNQKRSAFMQFLKFLKSTLDKQSISLVFKRYQLTYQTNRLEMQTEKREVAKAAKKHAAIRVQFSLRYSDAGFEKLHQLLAPMSALERSLYVKNVLLVHYKGFPQIEDASESDEPTVTKCSHVLCVRFSSRDAGLEILFNELCAIESSLDRARHIRQKLLVAMTSTRPLEPMPVKVLTAPAAKPSTFHTPVQKSSTAKPAKRDYGAMQFD